MKKYSYVLFFMLVSLLVGCTSKSATSDDMPYIGILQLTSHPALDAIAEGMVDELAEAGYVDGETAVIDLQNAQGDQSNMQTITERFIANDADVLVGIATPAAQTLANATNEIPVILGAITDPIQANLVNSLESPGGNVTGVSDKLPLHAQIEFMTALLPEMKKIGFLYSSSEDNSISAAKEAEDIATELGLEVVIKTVNSANEIAQVAESLAVEVDAIWVPTDNTIASSTPTLMEVTDAHGIPVFPSVDTMVKEGGVATIGLNQYDIGKQTGAVVVDVLRGAEPATYPIQFPSNIETIVNMKKAESLGITIPEAMKKDITIIIE